MGPQATMQTTARHVRMCRGELTPGHAGVTKSMIPHALPNFRIQYACRNLDRIWCDQDFAAQGMLSGIGTT